MEQIYKSSLHQDSSSGQSKDSFFLTIILLMAIGGLFLLYSDADANAGYSNDEIAPARIIQPKKQAPRTQFIPNASKEAIPSGKLLTTSLQPEAYQEFTFRLANYANNTLYQLDTGDGKMISFKNGEAKYTYKRHGKFYGKLHATYNNETKIIDEQSIQVAPGIVTASVPGLDY